MRKYKLFGKIPIFDLIVVAVIAVVALVGFKLVSTSKSGVSYTTAQTKEVILTVRFSNVSEQIKCEPSKGESVIETSTNNSLGTVESHSKTNYIAHDFDGEGKSVSTQYDDRFNHIIEIKATATMSDIETIVGGTRVGIGKSISCSMPSFSGTGTIIDIKEVSK